jgi:hypothetical protein
MATELIYAWNFLYTFQVIIWSSHSHMNKNQPRIKQGCSTMNRASPLHPYILSMLVSALGLEGRECCRRRLVLLPPLLSKDLRIYF